MGDEERAIRAVNDLIATYHDSEEGYAKAAKGTHDRHRSDRLAAISDQRGAYAQELRQAVAKAGFAASTDAHYGGILHRGWVDLETRLRGKQDIELFAECLVGDEATAQHLSHTLEQPLSAELRATVERQRREIDQQNEELRSWMGRHAQSA